MVYQFLPNCMTSKQDSRFFMAYLCEILFIYGILSLRPCHLPVFVSDETSDQTTSYLHTLYRLTYVAASCSFPATAWLSCCCRRRQEKKGKERKGDERYTKTKSLVGYISAIWGADPIWHIFTKIGRVVGVYDVIIQPNFGFNIFRGFRSTMG